MQDKNGQLAVSEQILQELRVRGIAVLKGHDTSLVKVGQEVELVNAAGNAEVGKVLSISETDITVSYVPSVETPSSGWSVAPSEGHPFS